MRVLVFGNSGSGKSTYARALADRHGVAYLDLDSIVWEPNQVAVLRCTDAISASLNAFLSGNAEWVVEGCYGELIEAAAPACTELVFLNPGEGVCSANNLRRPWEPHKYASPEQQNAMLAQLQAWVSEYYTRTESWSYVYHRRIFDAHSGAKVEYSSLPPSSVSGTRR
jgi:adenylate kinase family enzyme